MDLKEFAGTLNGCADISDENAQIAKDNGFVIASGQSNDAISFKGAIHDSGGCYGGVVRFTKKRVLNNWDEIKEALEYIKGIDISVTGLNEIEVSGCPDGSRWAYKTTIHHETFLMYEDGEIYCQGIVFKHKDIN